MIDLLKDKKERVIGTTGIKRLNPEEDGISDASGVQTFGKPTRSKEIERAGEAARESIAEHNGGLNDEDEDEDEDENSDSEEGRRHPKKPKKIDIRRYKDPEGLTLEKMEVGLWLVKHQKHMLFMFFGFLILISVFYWSKFVFSFGGYVVTDMRNDQRLADELVRKNFIGHDYFLSKAPANLSHGPVKLIRAGSGNYDIVVQLSNPNIKHWAHFNYSFEAGGKEIEQKQGFILPGEKKYILALDQDLGNYGSNINIRLNNISWVRVDLHKYPDWETFKDDRLSISISDVKFTPAKSTILTEKLNLNDLAFVVKNTTPFNYWQADFLILLVSNNRIVGATKYAANNFMSGDVKNVNVTWMGQLAQVSDVTIVPDIDITRNDIYVKFEGEIDNYYDK